MDPLSTMRYVLSITKCCNCILMLLILLSDFSMALNPIIINGNKMYDSGTGKRFYMKGITYEYAADDYYFDKYASNVFSVNLKDLTGHYNTVRLYNVNPDKSYAKFMNKMKRLGVYVLASASPANNEYYDEYRYSTMRKDLGPTGINTVKGQKVVDYSESCYPAKLLEYGKKVAKNFAQYDNTLGVIIANEIMQESLKPGACVKQYAADMKNWMRVYGKEMRLLPIAYAEADSAYGSGVPDADTYGQIRLKGLLCGDIMKNGRMYESIDIYMLNTYRWCEGDTFATAYQRLALWASGSPIVIALGEFGCRNSRNDPPRTWGMIEYMYGQKSGNSDFHEIYSGGIAYSYGQASQGDDSGYPMFLGGSQSMTGKPSDLKTEDYNNLVQAYSAVNEKEETAAWTSKTKCTWSSSIATPPSNLADPWIEKSCAKVTVGGSATSWRTNSRNGVVCNSDGSPCEVSISSPRGTTEKDICGFVNSAQGGAPCQDSADCGVNGVCINDECKCVGCYSGPRCDIYNFSECGGIKSVPEAPMYIWIGTAIITTAVMVSFGILFQRGQKELLFSKQIKTEVLATRSSCRNNAVTL